MNKTKPEWLKIRAATLGSQEMKNLESLRNTVKQMNLHTVCEEAHCPNICECWGMKTATFMILGDLCTRNCRFCNIKTGNPQRKVDKREPYTLAETVKAMGLDYSVITSVDRDDLGDFGAGHFAKCIEEIINASPDTLVEVLIPDFNGHENLLDLIIQAKPTVVGHNIETVERLTPKVRDMRASYRQSLEVLKYVKDTAPEIYTKSSIMVGFGEKEKEVIEALEDLREHKVDFVTIGQYLQPAKKFHPVKSYIEPKQFKKYEKICKELGFLYGYAGPFVRSSYKAGQFFLSKERKKQ